MAATEIALPQAHAHADAHAHAHAHADAKRALSQWAQPMYDSSYDCKSDQYLCYSFCLPATKYNLEWLGRRNALLAKHDIDEPNMPWWDLPGAAQEAFILAAFRYYPSSRTVRCRACRSRRSYHVGPEEDNCPFLRNNGVYLDLALIRNLFEEARPLADKPPHATHSPSPSPPPPLHAKQTEAGDGDGDGDDDSPAAAKRPEPEPEPDAQRRRLRAMIEAGADRGQRTATWFQICNSSDALAVLMLSFAPALFADFDPPVLALRPAADLRAIIERRVFCDGPLPALPPPSVRQQAVANK